MSLERSSITWSAKQVASMIRNGKISFDLLVQRGLVWEKTRKSELIESLILGYLVPPVIAKKFTKVIDEKPVNVYAILDGKQRLTTIEEFISGNFDLCGIKNEIQYEDADGNAKSVDVNGMDFEHLPEELQDKIKDTMFNITYFENITIDEEKELFRRINNGKPLSTKSKLLASCKDINALLDFGQHELFQKMLTDKQKENKDECVMIMKAYSILNNPIEDVVFSGDKFQKFINDAVITEDDMEEMAVLFDSYLNVYDIIDTKSHDISKKLFTETHMISILPVLRDLVQTESDMSIANAVMDFFNDMPQKYADATSNAVASKKNIVARDEALREFLTRDSELR